MTNVLRDYRRWAERHTTFANERTYTKTQHIKFSVMSLVIVIAPILGAAWLCR